MSATYRRTCQLSHGYKVEFIFKAGERFDCLWSPAMPPKEIGRKLIPIYLRERNAFLATLGVNVLVVDL